MRNRMYERDDWSHPDGSGLVGWVKSAGASPVAYLQPGNGPAAYANPGFRTLLANAIRWVASHEARGWASEHATVLSH
jgi:type 1 glutamine amidotransferase